MYATVISIFLSDRWARHLKAGRGGLSLQLPL
jgi:hypothetical protein